MDVRNRTAVAVGINGLEPYRLRITAKRFEIAPRDLRVGLRALWRVELSEAEDRLDVVILNGERVAVRDVDDDECQRKESLNHRAVDFVYTPAQSNAKFTSARLTALIGGSIIQ